MRTSTGQRPEGVGGCPGERGAATILALSIISVLLAVTVGGLALSSAVVASHQARLAADLAALAGAAELIDGAPAEAACAQASRVASVNHADLATCATEGLTVDLTVHVSAPPWTEPARARARAGPGQTDPR
jgi:secretion/DNA translocation related TadE-like protein